MEHELLTMAEDKMEKTVKTMLSNFSAIRAGRANPRLLDKVEVDYYGVPTPISQVSQISTPEPRMLMISLWDPSMLKSVEKAILASNIGITPSNDGRNIRLVFPEPTMERRQELVKEVAKYAEEAKVSVRSIRRDVNEKLEKEKKSSEITEDDFDVLKKQTQELTDKYTKKIDDLAKDKQKEIMEV